ncbi:PstS family phosphate ABC transporter substrate-binding protein [Stieleria varia]|uniref:Phosphate-binding protein n=1 Tax=Stieleria varia TaxID=2528005 RepID=A0A5C6AZD4_9BACT|nr:PstS family phosphate ABC transporter substrate-binding protein [Stieleria varia]TWU05060.1 Phosphate-binding protein PstS precursor [Stieleria varia]
MKRFLGNGFLACLVCLVAVTGCGPKTTTATTDSTTAEATSSDPAGSDSAGSGTAEVSNMSGTIKINGSSTVAPISDAVREKFIKQYPNVTVNVDGAGTGNGFKDFQKKATDISDASRPIKPGELDACRENGVQFIEIPVAYDGLTIVVHPDNDWVKTMTIEQLKKIFVAGSEAKKWSDVDAAWPAEEINIFAPGTGSGTYDYFREVVADGEGESLRNDMNLNEDDNILVQGVAGNKYSIGFFGVAYYEESKDKLKAVEIVNPEDGTAYLPTTENIASNKYAPFSRPLFIYVSTASLPRAEVATFVDFYLENVSELCEKVGYVRLPEEIIAKGRENLDNEAIGTHFVDAEGNKRSGPLAANFKAENLTK